MKRRLSISRLTKSVVSRTQGWWTRQLDHPIILLSWGIFAAGIGLVALLYAAIPSWRDGFFPGVFIEFNGMLFDILIFGILVATFVRRLERRQERQRQEEIIDDYKKWDSDEGKLRIAGAIRRLKRLGITNIDLTGIELSDFSFQAHDIESIKGATFYAGEWGLGSRSKMKLARVDFSSISCSEVVFSKSNPFGGLISGMFAELQDCHFHYTDLSKAVFKGAHLEWTKEPPDELGRWVDDEPPYFERTHFPPFESADLTGVSFANATFKNADFRESWNVQTCDFTGAEGLETCLFDDEMTKNEILAKSKTSTTD